MQRLFLCFVGFCAITAAQQRFDARAVSVELRDQHYRPFTAEANTAWLGVRLAEQQDPALAPGSQVGSVERSYAAGDTQYQKFAITGGTARPVFAVYSDENMVLNYEVVALVRPPGQTADRVVQLDRRIWPISKVSSSQVATRAPAYRAPFRIWEILIFIAFFAVAAGMIYIAFGLTLFRRLLFNRRWRVASAENCSNFIVGGMALLLVAVMYLMIFNPALIVPGDYGWSVAATMAIFVAVLGASAAFGTLVTPKR